MRIRTLAAQIAFLNELLGVIPGTTGVSHHQRHQNAAQQPAGKHAAEGGGTQAKANDDGRKHRDGAGHNHALECRCGRNIDAAGSVWFRIPLQQARNLAELATDLVDHVECSIADSGHGDRRDQEWNRAANEYADQHFWIREL